ncbi:MAG: hypothetical protein ACHQ5A_04235 [Opitutales bacterium]
MINKFLIALGLVSALLTSCTTPQYNYKAEATQISEPPLHTIATAQVGEEMVKQGRFYQQDAIHLTQNIEFGGLFTVYTLSVGDYVKTGEDNDSDFYFPAVGHGAGTVKKAALADPWVAIEMNKREPKIGVITVFHVKVSATALGVSRVKRLALADDAFQQTLIYSGKNGNKVRLGYREFSNSVARPAFNNDVEYDLTESTVIGYKGARVEIIEATNEFIRYKVIQNFNQAAN